MSKSLSDHIAEIHQQFDDIIDKIEDGAEDFADEVKDLWGASKVQLKAVKARLAEASQHAQASGEEAQLQAHLAAMDAHDHWQSLKHNVNSLIAYVQHKTQPSIDHAALQAHLAKMEARDFMAENGHDLAQDFKNSIEKSQQLSQKAAAEIKESCDGIITGLPK